jgi:hypothetical protein
MKNVIIFCLVLFSSTLSFASDFSDAAAKYQDGISIKSTQILGVFSGTGSTAEGKAVRSTFGCKSYPASITYIIGCTHLSYYTNPQDETQKLGELRAQLESEKNIDFNWNYPNGDLCLLETRTKNTCFRVNRGQFVYAVIDTSIGAIIEAGELN